MVTQDHGELVVLSVFDKIKPHLCLMEISRISPVVTHVFYTPTQPHIHTHTHTENTQRHRKNTHARTHTHTTHPWNQGSPLAAK